MHPACFIPAVVGAEGDYRPFSMEQIDQLTAQVALFPDALISQVLMAATYPADVAEAALWSRASPDENGDAAVALVADKPWDPSVQSLVAFPQVIVIEQRNPQVIFVPMYNPVHVFGPWMWPLPPAVFIPPPIGF